MIRVLLSLILLSQIPWASATITSTADASGNLQEQVDLAFREIMQTQIGQAVCRNILGANPQNLVFHLGVSPAAAEEIVHFYCKKDVSLPWVYDSLGDDIQKFNLGPPHPRVYKIAAPPTIVPLESWTDPYSNVTFFFAAAGDLPFERLVQLLAHEMAVYFDSKSNPADRDAQKIPELKNLRLSSTSGMDPLVAISDPLVAHTLTFVRALRVEFSIVTELVANHRIRPPIDYQNKDLLAILAPSCRKECLEHLVEELRQAYLPISLPLLGFAPKFRSLLAQELIRVPPDWNSVQWSGYQKAVNDVPTKFQKNFTPDNADADAILRLVFGESQQSSADFQSVAAYERDGSLWDLERAALTGAAAQVLNSPDTPPLGKRLKDPSVNSSQPLYEFMKEPLLSGRNVNFSSGPRVRIRIGIVAP